MKGLILATVVLLAGVPVFAQGTPDGETRAQKDGCFSPLEWAGEWKAGFRACKKTAGCEICAAESGAAFGLCTAYCEAMDCAGEEPAASEAACLKVKDPYIQVTGNEALPCEEDGGGGAHCGSFAACIECLDAGVEAECIKCADDLRSTGGCTNICNP